ncbi:S41 family peptidase [Bacteroidetes/Chlorobi group bacterium MS-B_bin-24]|nr:MAG: S41 family peptidase [Bacteroidetes/Chlorobi group bacterium MS-B_bin-24]
MKKSFLFSFFVALFLFLFFPNGSTFPYNQNNKFAQSLAILGDDDPPQQEIDNEEDENDNEPNSPLDTLSLEGLIKLLNELIGKESYTGDPNSDTLYLKIKKSFDIFGAAFGEILKNYVVKLDPEDLAKDAIKGITDDLDPYTNFFDSESELNEAISNNDFVGLGIVVVVSDSSLIVVDYIDSLAKHLSGLKLGDKIIGFDSVRIPPNLDTLRKFTSGKENTPVTVLVKREGIDTPIVVNTFRRKIELHDVSLFKIFDADGGKICYVRLEHFLEKSIEELKSLIKNFVSRPIEQRKGIIIDLRDNPGGTLESAIQLSEMFLPPGSLIVSTRGRNTKDSVIYLATMAPIDTVTPLVILVNNGTASASEVVAGAIQDNDRGLIIGEQTYGKGVVQSVVPLPYNTFLKLTTSKYFTPSGRSIHRNRFTSKSSDLINKIFVSDTIFHTKNGRIVKESDGIQPDIPVKSLPENTFINFLFDKNLFLLFVSYLENTNQSKEYGNQPKEKLLKDFAIYLKKKGIIYRNPFEIYLDSLMKYSSYLPSNKKAEKVLLSLIKMSHRGIDDYVKEQGEKIYEILTYEIYRRKASFEESRFVLLQKDPYFKEALKVLLDKRKYNQLLGKVN